MLSKVKGTEFLRDTDNLALLNNDINGLEAYRSRRQQMIKQKEEIDSLKGEISSVKSEISEIKQLLLKALDK